MDVRYLVLDGIGMVFIQVSVCNNEGMRKKIVVGV